MGWDFSVVLWTQGVMPPQHADVALWQQMVRVGDDRQRLEVKIPEQEM